MIVDEQVLLIGSENLNHSSTPASKSDGAEDNRGVWLIILAPIAVAHALEVFPQDLEPDN